MRYRKTISFALVVLASTLIVACAKKADVTLYVALDEEHSRSLIAAFEKQTGLKVNPRFDTEASKTVGLVSAIIEEAARPRCDVFWNNEIAQTVRLAQRDYLASYSPPSAKDIPARYKDKNGKWTGFAARARILIVNTELIAKADYPSSIHDLLDPKWKGRCAVARPLTGTTLTHFAALANVMGKKNFEQFIDGLFANEVVILASNGATMRETAAGKIAWAITDTDDFNVALQKGLPVAAVYPDQEEGQIGTMLIPNSASLIKDCPNLENAKRLLDWIVSAQTERALASGKSAQIPLRPDLRLPLDASVRNAQSFKTMDWDLETTAASLSAMAQYFAKRFGG